MTNEEFYKDLIKKITRHIIAYDRINESEEPFRISKNENKRLFLYLKSQIVSGKDETNIFNEGEIPKISYLIGCKIEII